MLNKFINKPQKTRQIAQTANSRVQENVNLKKKSRNSNRRKRTFEKEMFGEI